MRSIVKKGSSNSFNYVTAMRIFFPIVILLWFFIFAFTKSSPTTNGYDVKGRDNIEDFKNKLRGSNANSNDKEKTNGNVVLASELDAGSSQHRTGVNLPNHAIIVAGHAVMNLNYLSTADKSDSAWYLLPYQKDQGFPSIISSHIQAGIKAAEQDYQSLLLFSGGQTRKDVGPTSEAASYYYLANKNHWISNIESRVYLEEYARDSFENLLFSLCRFREITGSYPTKITVVGFDFKEERFTQLHRKAIGFPSSNFTYIGIKAKHVNFDNSKAIAGEKLAALAFQNDMYGCTDPSLYSKREIRNPFSRTVPYTLACPEIKSLIDYCSKELYSGNLPWNTTATFLSV